jgi:Holliday junction resolvase-like predicted endonuclease
MPGINFFEYARDEDIVEGSSLFGICDDPGELPAFISNNRNDHTWVATVSNPGRKRIQFLPVDKHIPLKRQDGTDAMRCDAMLLTSPLYTKETIVFIELKDVIPSARNAATRHAIEQLRETIESFSEYHQLDTYKKRLAYVANRRHPQANKARTNDIQKFRNDYGITLKFSAEIVFS